ncbi:MAG: helix-turn-helix transcriptional regulator [Labilithrix sp.]|nr:helix-turn-helix transcriptional regulator [Labilithrix sp.]MBX3219194.1 helix-turn-helix transcriptional regulator [Labilithrix sp.]
MAREERSLVSIDALARSTANYRPWLEGSAATAKQIGVHGFRFDAHDQLAGVALDAFHAILCLRGQASIRRAMGDAVEVLELGPGDVLVNPMAVPLRWSWSGAVEVLNVTVHPGYLDELLRESVGGAARLRPRVVPYSPDPTLADLGLELLHELSTPQLLGAHRGARATGERIALHVLRRYTDVEYYNHDRTFTPDERRLLLEYVEARLDEPIRVERLASLVRLGEHHFTRTFRATFGQSPQSWLRERRLERARELLVTTSQSISSIAMATGFSDQSHFTRCFGAAFGVTPAALRRGQRAAHRGVD